MDDQHLFLMSGTSFGIKLHGNGPRASWRNGFLWVTGDGTATRSICFKDDQRVISDIRKFKVMSRYRTFFNLPELMHGFLKANLRFWQLCNLLLHRLGLLMGMGPMVIFYRKPIK